MKEVILTCESNNQYSTARDGMCVGEVGLCLTGHEQAMAHT